MSPKPARRRRPTRILWIGGAIVTLIVILSTALPHSEWARLEAEVDAAITAAGALLEAERAPVFGAAVEGAAWPIYRSAHAAADVGRLDRLAEGSGAEPAEREAVLLDHAAVVEQLIDGARRTRVGRPLVPDPREPLQVLDGMAIGSLLLAAAGDRDRDGDPEGAATRLATALRFARDRASGGHLVDHLGGTASARSALFDLGRLVAARRLPHGTLERVDAFLVELDDAWPTLADALRRETAGFGAYVRDAARDGKLIEELEIGRLMTWRYLFSDRRLALAWWDLRRTQLRLVDFANALPWPAARAVLADEPRPEPGDPLGVISPALGRWASEPREIRACIRLVRMTIRFVVTGEAGTLEDPLSGHALKSAATATGMRFWSVGADGVDDGGEGSMADEGGPDLVLEVPR